MGADFFLPSLYKATADEGRGYFRDSYNSSCLLSLFDLSWWRDVANVLTDEQGRMSPRNARRFLHWLTVHEPIFEARLSRAPLKMVRFFRERYSRLKSVPATSYSQPRAY